MERIGVENQGVDQWSRVVSVYCTVRSIMSPREIFKSFTAYSTTTRETSIVAPVADWGKTFVLDPEGVASCREQED